jgi:hypothetical protein
MSMGSISAPLDHAPHLFSCTHRQLTQKRTEPMQVEEVAEAAYPPQLFHALPVKPL